MKKRILVAIALGSLLMGQLVIPVRVAWAAPERPDTPDETEETVDLPDEVEETDEPEEPDEPGGYEDDSGIEEEKDEENEEEPEEETESLGVEEDEEEEGDGNTGQDVEIETGDVSVSGAITNTGNMNASVSGLEEDDVTIVNEGNGEESENTGSVTIIDEEETGQNNTAKLDNELEVEVDSGNNSASKNTGGNVKIETGDANASGVIVNAVNTNVDGVMVSEFNVMDDMTGDLVLEFEEETDILLANKGNGGDSKNEVELALMESDATFQENSAEVENEMILVANSGNNVADKNTGGDVEIETGDANIAGSVLNFLNNNFAGEVIYGVVNIFGEMVGDIIIPEKYFSSGVELANEGNGEESENLAEADLVSEDEYVQFNTAEIINNVDLSATTGENAVSGNTGGDSYIVTGDVGVDVDVVNIANNNVVGGDWWLVFVNEAGNWVGKLIGLPGSVYGENYMASEGSVVEEENGVMEVKNVGNGAGSENSGTLTVEDGESVTQLNDAKVVNNITLDANTGGNSASKNVGGDNMIKTGDADVKLTLMNFVNNNFVGGRVFLTVVNVFGSWMGDLVGPGAEKEVYASEGDETENGDESENGDSGSDESGVGGGGGTGRGSESSGGGSSSGGSGSSSGGSSGESSAYVAMATEQSWVGGSGWLGSGEGQKLALVDEGAEDVLGVSSEDARRRINLAWGLMVVPLYGAYLGGKRWGVFAMIASRLGRG